MMTALYTHDPLMSIATLDMHISSEYLKRNPQALVYQQQTLLNVQS